jgi:hypothetical protein
VSFKGKLTPCVTCNNTDTNSFCNICWGKRKSIHILTVFWLNQQAVCPIQQRTVRPPCLFLWTSWNLLWSQEVKTLVTWARRRLTGGAQDAVGAFTLSHTYRALQPHVRGQAPEPATAAPPPYGLHFRICLRSLQGRPSEIIYPTCPH